MRICFLLVLATVWGFAEANAFDSSSAFSQPTKLKLLPDQRIVVIGDVHGNLNGLKKILSDHGVIDENDQFVGKNVVVILEGDLVSKGMQSFRTLEFVMNLQRQASVKGEYVYPLIGNHDVQFAIGEYPKPSDDDREFLQLTGQDRDEIFLQIRDRYGSANLDFFDWMISRPAVLQIDDMAFFHSGASIETTIASPDEVNLRTKEIITDALNLPLDHKPRDPVIRSFYERMRFLRARTVGEHSETELEQKKRRRAVFLETLENWNVSWIFAGHQRVLKPAGMLEHPWLGDQILRTDTGIYHDKLFSLVIDSDYVQVVDHRELTPIAMPGLRRLRPKTNSNPENISAVMGSANQESCAVSL